MSIQRLTYGQIREVLESDDSMKMKGYISDSLAVIKGNPLELVSRVRNTPFRLDEMRMLIVEDGEAHPIINLRQYDAHSGDLIFMSGGSIAQINGARPDTAAFGMSCTNELLALAFDGRLPKILNRPRFSFVLHMKDKERQFLKKTYSLLWQSVHDEDISPQVSIRLVSTILTYIDHLYLGQEKKHTESRNHEETVFDKFINLVNQYGTTEHKLQFYADKLFISQRYLGAIVKRVSGESAKEWIDQQMITSIKVELLHTDKSLKEIANEMDFPNMSFFSKYFKRLTGMTPLEYKNRQPT